MSNLQEVLEFIKNSNDKLDLKSIYNSYAVRMSEIKNEIKNSFMVGDVVSINHKKIDPKQNFRITKINNKNIKVQASDVGDGRVGGMYTVSPSLLVKK